MAQDLAGVWEGRQDFGPRIQGVIHLRTGNDEHHLEVAGVRTTVTLEDSVLRAELPANLGRLDAWRDRDGWKGHWIQPATPVFGQAYASPVEFTPAQDSARWTGVVAPLPYRMTHHFVIIREGDTLAVFLRNPDVNLGRLLRFNRLITDGDRLNFLGTTPWNGDEHLLAEGHYHEPEDQITLRLPGFGEAMTLRRVTDDRSSTFHPRPEPDYAYSKPLQLDDGWRTSSAGEEAVSRLSSFVSELVESRPTSPASPDIHAVLIAHEGRLVFEEYFHGHDRDSAHDTRSASKSLTTVLAGAAMHAGEPVTLDQRLVDDPDDPRFGITLEHLATMSSGLACDDWDDESPGGEDRMQSDHQDWYAFTRSLEVVHPPGTHAAYCSGGMNLVGQMLSQATGKSLMRLFHETIAQPLGLGPYYMNLSPTGVAYMGGGIRWRARDFLKLGQVVLDEGVWSGRRILDKEYARQMVTPRFKLGSEADYALGWWVRDYEFRGRTYKAFFAGGNGGQILMGFPELDAVVLFYGGNYGTSGTFAAQRTFIPEQILPAILAM